jgi:flavin reductase (DIM6/NTAB) family NADH-FMN oxidoreductase RutF
MSFTAREFRDALGLFPTGVAVVTACGAGGEVAGVTINSFTSVSLDPPLVLVSLARNLRSFELFDRATHFAVSLLKEDQRHVSSAFARVAGDKWADAQHRPGVHACPILHPNLAAFECECHARYDGGDHVLLLGRVVRIEQSEEVNPRPLLYFRGQYRELSDEHAEIAPFRLEGW